jgi:hypothetical protein
VLAYLGLRLDEFHAVGAFLLVVVFQELLYGHVGLQLDIAMDEFMIADRIDAVEIVQVYKEFAGSFACHEIRTVVQDKSEGWGEIAFGHATFQVFGMRFFHAVAVVLALDGRQINYRSGKGVGAAYHHGHAFFFSRKQHVAAGRFVAIAFFELVPAFGEQGTIIVEADEQNVRSPSQAIADVKGRGLAAGEPLLAIGTVVLFAGKSDASFDVHGDILRKRMAFGVGGGAEVLARRLGCYCFVSSRSWGDAFFKSKDEKAPTKSNRKTIREPRYFIKNFTAVE